MIPIFDLDDTLYSERSFVESGFFAVSKELERIFGWSTVEIFNEMIFLLSKYGRGTVFDKILSKRNKLTKKNIKHCLNIYRYHKPNISLDKTAQMILESMRYRPYLVTDGNKLVQANKVRSLNIEKYFQEIYITHRFGIKNAKPSTYCFELIKKKEKQDWSDMFYVGDNPNKDFVNLNLIGVKTIRIRQGDYAKTVARKGFDANYHIDTLEQLPSLIKDIFSDELINK